MQEYSNCLDSECKNNQRAYKLGTSHVHITACNIESLHTQVRCITQMTI